MRTGRVLSGALRLLRRRRLVLIGMTVAFMGLVYALLDAILRSYNKNYLTDLANSLSTKTPNNFGWILLLAVVTAVVGGLVAEGDLILGARAAYKLRDQQAEETKQSTAKGAVRRLPQLLAVGFLVWWKLLLALLIVLSPVLIWNFSGQSASDGWVLGVLGSSCLGLVFFLIGWFWWWPQQRLANCALLLENLSPRAAVASARKLYIGNLGSTLGFWVVLLLLNLAIGLVSLLLAAIGAGLVSAIWSLLNGVEENAALVIIAVVAVLIGLLLLVWDGVVSAFNLNAWVLAYIDLRSGGASAQLFPQNVSGSTQMLGRQRDTETEL